eukprot:jgi/Bigna1/85000/estExt_fgenesh1_pg.C_10567
MKSAAAVLPCILVAFFINAVASVNNPVKDCGNGNGCLASQTCVSSAEGPKFPVHLNIYSRSTWRLDEQVLVSCTVVRPLQRLRFENVVSVPLMTNMDAVRIIDQRQDVGDSSDFCSDLTKHLPSECNCVSSTKGGVVNCSISLLGKDTVEVIAEIMPCGDPAELTAEIKETVLGIDSTFGVKSGEVEQFAIPGLTIGVPVIGNIGIYADLELKGNASNLEINLALDGCAKVLGKTSCGAKLTHKLPITILDGTYSFEDCN